ncbi:hypothetical protein [Acinetobacter sp. WZC-1]|uniref:hypothetical protein n=1 Tax=Acinetobacter sp. WZC-1 TaxID=3459034 RepID=UPI00403DB287
MIFEQLKLLQQTVIYQQDGHGVDEMKLAKKHILYLCFFIVVAVTLLFFIKKEETTTNGNGLLHKEISKEEPAIENGNQEDVPLNVTKDTRDNQGRMDRSSFVALVNFSEIMKKGAENNGVVYTSLNNLDPVSRKGAEGEIKNLYEKGSLSGGLRVSEFSELEKARENLQKEGIKKISSQLDNFAGTNDQILNDYGLKLTGAQNFGRYDSENGWNSIYKLYEGANQKVEIEQSYLKAGESSHQFIAESLNIALNQNTPARYEKLSSDLIEKLTFVNDSNYYQINGQNLKPDQIQEIANKIIATEKK